MTMTITSGFLVVKTFESLYRKYAQRYRLTRDLYALPRIDKPAAFVAMTYRGMDREALTDSAASELLPEIRMAEMAKEGRCTDGFLSSQEDAQKVCRWLSHPADYETIWARAAGTKTAAPSGFRSEGFEPTTFTGDHFSPSCDSLFFPRTHDTPDEGLLFLDHFRKLNSRGLFINEKDAQAFLKAYSSFDWTGTGDYLIAEIFTRGDGR